MYSRFIGARKDVLKTRAFWAAICIPITTAIVIALFIYYCVPFKEWLSHLWETMKLPIAIASLSIPLATWAIANHGSARVTETLKTQDRKQLSELYFEQEKLFEKVLTRKIEHYEFKYITIKDLPVIHATIFDYKNIHKNGNLVIRGDVSDKIKEVIRVNNDANLYFYEVFIAERNERNDSIKMLNMTASYISIIQNNLMSLTPYTGCRVLREGVTSLGLLASAFIEIEHMMQEINQYISDDLPVNYMTEEDCELYNAIINVTSEYYGCEANDLTIAKLHDSISMKITIKHFAKSDLHRFIFSVMDKITPIINDASSHLTIQQEDGEYLSIRVFHNNPDDFIRIFFTKDEVRDVRVGILNVQWNDESYEIDVICKDNGHAVGHSNSEQNYFINFIHTLSRTLYFTGTSKSH